MKIRIWVNPESVRSWMIDREKNLIYQMDFSYRKSMHFTQEVTIDFDPASTELSKKFSPQFQCHPIAALGMKPIEPLTPLVDMNKLEEFITNEREAMYGK